MRRASAALLAAAVLAGCTPAGATSTGGQQGSLDSSAGPTSRPAPAPSPTATVLPDPALAAAAMAKVKRKGIGASGLVVLAPDGSVIASRGADKALAPASTLKVLTTLAALDTLGADARFTTRVVGSGKQLVLVGGGDPLLTDKQSKSAAKPASLQALADATAAALAARGVKKVELGYDTSLFTGPDFHPRWKAKWRSWVARVTPLLVGSGRFNQWQADPAPSKTAATAFAKRLRKAGVAVTKIRPARAAAGAAEVASVQSAPLATVIAHTLTYSDNLAAEVILRQLALASGRKGSFTGGADALTGWLTGHGLWADGMRVLDGSGLSGSDRVTPAVLASAVRASLTDPDLAAVAAGFPVAGVSGTLEDRFDDASERVARGNVHAKTGTLVGIAGLTGYLTTADGARLVFAIVANRTSGQTTAYNWLDRSTAVLVRCGCR